MRQGARPSAWQVVVQFKVTRTGLRVHGTGHGTGALRGMTMKSHDVGAVDLQPGENPCSDVYLFAGLLAGEVLIPAAKTERWSRPPAGSQLCHAFSEPGGQGRTREDTRTGVIEYRRTLEDTGGHRRVREDTRARRFGTVRPRVSNPGPPTKF